MRRSAKPKSAIIDTDTMTLSEKQIKAVRLSQLDIKNGKFIENRLFEKEVKIWLKNR